MGFDATTMLPVHDHFVNGFDAYTHDERCMGECPTCYGAGACSMVGWSCRPCDGCNAYLLHVSRERLGLAA